MKVIDLLVKIANGDEVPKKIKLYNDIFEFDTYNKLYWSKQHKSLLELYNGYILTKEVEILEDTPKEEIQVLSRWWPPKEDKKIEKLDLEDDGNTITLFGEKENEWTILDNVDIIVCNKLNEIIDKINGEENEVKKDDTFEDLFNTLSGRCKKLIDYIDDLKDSNIISVKVAKDIKGIIQSGF